MLIKLSLFSGIGGDDLASEWAGIKTVCFVENNKYCQKVLAKHWPDIPIIEDVKDVTKEKVMAYARLLGQAECQEQTAGIEQQSETMGDTFRIGQSGESRRRTGTFVKDRHWGDTTWAEPTIDIISGGFPCQPHSVAGKRKGSGDERNLWPEFRRIIGEIKPRWVVAENVPGIYSSDARRFFGEVLADLAALGYVVGWCTYGAVDVGAWHRRDRVFIVAYAVNGRPQDIWPESAGSPFHSSPFRQDNGRGRGKLDGEAAGREGNDPAVIAGGQDVADTERARWAQARAGTNINTGTQSQTGNRGEWESGQSQSRLGRVASRLPGWVYGYWDREPEGIPLVATGIKDRVNKLKGLGNAVVPQQIYPIYKAIVEIEANR